VGNVRFPDSSSQEHLVCSPVQGAGAEQNRPLTCSVPQSRFARAQRSAIKQQAQLLMICGFHSLHTEVMFYLALRNSGDELARRR
jgi:hypothetical protein